MCPPCVGASYYPNRACKPQGTCLMDYRARNASDTSRRTRHVARGPITRTRRETTQTATPTQRPDPGKKEHRQATSGPPGKKEHRQATFFEAPSGKKEPTSIIRTTWRGKKKTSNIRTTTVNNLAGKNRETTLGQHPGTTSLLRHPPPKKKEAKK